MSEQPIKVKCVSNLWSCVTHGKEYLAQRYSDYYKIVCDDFIIRSYSKEYFIVVEETKMNEVETKQYLKLSTGLVYDLVFEGERLNVLKAVLSGSEGVVHIDDLKNPHFFVPYTKQMKKQQKKNEDLGVLANVTDEIRKLLDDNHVICHASVNRDTKGLVEYTIMVGESV